MKLCKKIYSLLFLLALSITVLGQGENQTVQMADLMRSNGRIYVVVAVMLTILTGLILYLVRLDRKISRLEKEIK
ncbi:MAG: CcmD family protein [Bacteroidetes bacterium]|nr:CcmD family protein [Bacteroidota bacterium]MBS1929705.1 CcmD family protein [Bacteroidota bacterium]